MSHKFSVILLCALAFSLNIVAAEDPERSTSKPLYRPETPLAVVALKDLNHLLGFLVSLNNSYNKVEYTREQFLAKRSPIFYIYGDLLSKFNHELPLGVMAYFNPQKSDILCSYVVFLPSQDNEHFRSTVKSLLQTYSDPPIEFKHNKKNEQEEEIRFNIEGGEFSFLFRGDYMYFTNDTKLIELGIPEPKKITDGFFDQHTVVAQIDANGITTPVRQTFLNYFKAATNSMQMTSGNLFFETDNNSSQLHDKVTDEISHWLESLNTVRLSLVTHPDTLKTVIDYELKFHPDSHFGKTLTQPARQDEFANCQDDKALLNAHYAQRFSLKERQSYLESLELCHKKYLETIPEPDRTPAVADFFETLKTTFKQLESINIFLHTGFSVNQEELTFVFGIHLPTKKPIDAGLKELLEQISFPIFEAKGMKLELNTHQHQGISFHRITRKGFALGYFFSEQNDNETQYNFGVGHDSLWMAIGGADAVNHMHQQIDNFLDKPKSNEGKNIAAWNGSFQIAKQQMEEELKNQTEPGSDADLIKRLITPGGDKCSGSITSQQHVLKAHLEFDSFFLNYANVLAGQLVNDDLGSCLTDFLGITDDFTNNVPRE